MTRLIYLKASKRSVVFFLFLESQGGVPSVGLELHRFGHQIFAEQDQVVMFEDRR